MKRIAIIIGITATLTLLVSFVNRPEPVEQNEIAIVQTFITGVSGKAIISYPDGTLEEFELEGLNGKKLESYTKKLTQLLNSMNKKGYQLIETMGSGSGSGQFIFAK